MLDYTIFKLSMELFFFSKYSHYHLYLILVNFHAFIRLITIRQC